eukprot:1886131-Pyramimonas_sp.AAC.1
MREAARYARNAMFTHDPTNPESKMIILRSVARAVWRQDIVLARRLLRYDLAREHLSVDESTRRISLCRPACFAEALDALQFADAEEEQRR